jgi:hypothetical protein
MPLNTRFIAFQLELQLQSKIAKALAIREAGYTNNKTSTSKAEGLQLLQPHDLRGSF